MKFDLTKWRKVRLGDVVQQIKDQVKTEESDLKYYVAGEHFSSDDLHLTGKGLIEGSTIGPAFTVRFKPGQVLLMSRRPNLRKMAVADFEGICSNVTYVLESKTEELLLQNYLPFVIKANRFWKFGIANQRGSTNPYLNWSDYAQYEFILPPIEEQRRIAKVLWALDACLEQHRQVSADLRKLKNAFLEEWIKSKMDYLGPFSTLWTASPDSGCSAPQSPAATGHMVLSLSALSTDGYVSGCFKNVDPTAPMLKAILKQGDLLISRSNTAQLVGFAGIFNEERTNVSFPDTMMRINIDENRAIRRYVEIMLLSSIGRKHMKTVCAGTSDSMKKINRKSLGAFEMPIVPMHEQLALIERMDNLDSLQIKTIDQIETDNKLSYQLLLKFEGDDNV